MATWFAGNGAEIARAMAATVDAGGDAVSGVARLRDVEHLREDPSDGIDGIPARIRQVMERLPDDAFTGLRGAVLRLCVSMSDASCRLGGNWELDADLCKSRREDAVAYLYCGLREVDLVREPLARVDMGQLPEVVVEDSPQLWAEVVRCSGAVVDRARELGCGANFGRAGRLGVLAGEFLKAEAAGDSIRTETSGRHMLELLVSDCKELGQAGHPVQLEGGIGPIRRSGTYVQKVTLDRQGRHERALCVRVGVESAQGSDWVRCGPRRVEPR